MEAATFKAPIQIDPENQFKKKFPNRGPPKQSDFLRKRLQGAKGPKYFDSGDYVLSKNSKTKDSTIVVGQAHPTPSALPQRKPSCSNKQSTLIDGQPHDEKEASSHDDDAFESEKGVQDEQQSEQQ